VDHAETPVTYRPILRGAPYILHGGDYNPDHWRHLPEAIDDDFRLMPLAGCNTFSIGIFSWSQLEPREGEYTLDWIDDIMDRMAAAGHNVILATPTGAKPFWMSEKYPEVRRVDAAGRREPSQSRHNFCWSSPVYRAKSRALAERLAGRYGRHPALKMWHISNELGGHCFCDLCKRGFHAWLERRYGTPENLNRAYWAAFWSHRVSAWAEVNPQDGTLDGAELDWLRYQAELLVDWVRWEIEPLKRLAPDVPVTTNLMGPHPTNHYRLLAPLLDEISEDLYPGFCTDHPDPVGRAAESGFETDFIRCLKGAPRRWFDMETAPDARGLWGQRFGLKPDGMHGVEMLQNLAHGSEGTLYFQWRKGRGGAEKFHGAVVSHTGGEHTRVFREVQRWSARIPKLNAVLGSINRCEAAIVFDQEVRWACRSSEFERARGQWGMSRDFYASHARDWHRSLWDLGVGTDVVDGDHDWAPYRLIVAPLFYMLRPGVAEKIRRYVEGGGVFLAGYYLGIVNESGLVNTDGWPGHGLEEVFGVWTEEFDLLREGTTFAGRATRRVGRAGAGRRCEFGFINGHLHARNAEVLAACEGGLFAGQPLLTRRAAGRGAAWYLGSVVDAGFRRDVVAAALAEAGVPGWLPGYEPLPEGVSVQTRRRGAESFHFLLNFTPGEKRLTIAPRRLVDIETGEALPPEITLGRYAGLVARQSD
jgi:beta-galactosidase